jgi:hypothetical protein
MGDIDNGIHELLVATAEPDEEANRRCRQRIWIVFSLVLGAIDAVLLLMFLYYGLKDDSGIIPLWAIPFAFGVQAFVLVYPFVLHRHRIWKIICIGEKAWQIDAEFY